MDSTESETEVISAFFRSHLQQVVQIHGVMFDRLLSEDLDIPLELAELFEDAANTYLEISEAIAERYSKRKGLNLGRQSKPAIELAWSMVETKLLPEPGVPRSENVTEPLENDPDRPGAEPLG